jgi:hypothetical protein
MTDLPPSSASALDLAAAAMPSSEAARLQFYHIFAETPLTLLLQREAVGEDLAPMSFDLPTGAMILAFDSEDRLAAWAASQGQGALPYAQIPGRVLAGLIAGQDGLDLGLNFGAGTASEMVLPHAAMDWLAEMLAVAPQEQAAQVTQVLPLGVAPAGVVQALSRALIGAGGLAEAAVLARVAYQSGAQAHVLAFFGAAPAAEAPLARAVAQALAFSGLEAAAVDVIFPAPSRTAAALRAQGQPIALPAVPVLPDPAPPPRAPGMDKDAPPKLR